MKRCSTCVCGVLIVMMMYVVLVQVYVILRSELWNECVGGQIRPRDRSIIVALCTKFHVRIFTAGPLIDIIRLFLLAIQRILDHFRVGISSHGSVFQCANVTQWVLHILADKGIQIRVTVGHVHSKPRCVVGHGLTNGLWVHQGLPKFVLFVSVIDMQACVWA